MAKSEKYFEKVEENIENKPVKRTWTVWKTRSIVFHDLNNKLIRIPVIYRDNGKKVQVKCCAYKSESTCCNEDVFDFNKGFDLAVKRLIIKYLAGQVNKLANDM